MSENEHRDDQGDAFEKIYYGSEIGEGPSMADRLYRKAEGRHVPIKGEVVRNTAEDGTKLGRLFSYTIQRADIAGKPVSEPCVVSAFNAIEARDAAQVPGRSPFPPGEDPMVISLAAYDQVGVVWSKVEEGAPEYGFAQALTSAYERYDAMVESCGSAEEWLKGHEAFLPSLSEEFWTPEKVQEQRRKYEEALSACTDENGAITSQFKYNRPLTPCDALLKVHGTMENTKLQLRLRAMRAGCQWAEPSSSATPPALGSILADPDWVEVPFEIPFGLPPAMGVEDLESMESLFGIPPRFGTARGMPEIPSPHESFSLGDGQASRRQTEAAQGEVDELRSRIRAEGESRQGKVGLFRDVVAGGLHWLLEKVEGPRAPAPDAPRGPVVAKPNGSGARQEVRAALQQLVNPATVQGFNPSEEDF